MFRRFRYNLCAVHSYGDKQTHRRMLANILPRHIRGWQQESCRLVRVAVYRHGNHNAFCAACNFEDRTLSTVSLYTMSVVRPTSSFAAAAAAAASKLYILVALLLVIHVNGEQTNNTPDRRSLLLDDGKGETPCHSFIAIFYLFVQNTT